MWISWRRFTGWQRSRTSSPGCTSIRSVCGVVQSRSSSGAPAPPKHTGRDGRARVVLVGKVRGKGVVCLSADGAWCFALGSESLQREELSHHEHPRADAQCPGLPGECCGQAPCAAGQPACQLHEPRARGRGTGAVASAPPCQGRDCQALLATRAPRAPVPRSHGVRAERCSADSSALGERSLQQGRNSGRGAPTVRPQLGAQDLLYTHYQKVDPSVKQKDLV